MESVLDVLEPATGEKPGRSAAALRDDRPAQPGSYIFPIFPMADFQWLARSVANK
jgi:hypothetical protein